MTNTKAPHPFLNKVWVVMCSIKGTFNVAAPGESRPDFIRRILTQENWERYKQDGQYHYFSPGAFGSWAGARLPGQADEVRVRRETEGVRNAWN